MDTPWRIELLGRLRATQGDRVVTRFRAQRTGLLLAYLAYHVRQPHPRVALIELLWPGVDPHSGRANLRRELSSLRRELEQLTAGREQAGDYQGAIQWARQAVAVDPLREEGQHELIRLLQAAGQPAAAWRQYQELERLLAQELGAAPSAETRALAGTTR